MKFDIVVDPPMLDGVAPFTGAWIEIRKNVAAQMQNVVAPFTGAWIEINTTSS